MRLTLKKEGSPITLDPPFEREVFEKTDEITVISPEIISKNIILKYNQEFELHQSYEEKEDTKTAVCAHCNGNEFKVGIGSYFTVVKCIGCARETCVHEG